MFLNVKSLFCDTIFFEKITKFLRGGDSFSVTKFLSRFRGEKSLLNFRFLKIKMLITSYLISKCNFQAHFWNKRKLLVIILENEVNRKGSIITTQPPIHPPIHPSIYPPTHQIQHFGTFFSEAEIAISSTLRGTE